MITFLNLKYDIRKFKDRIERNSCAGTGGWIIGGGGGGGKGYVGPPLKLLGGLAPPGPPSSYAYVEDLVLLFSEYGGFTPLIVI